MASTGSGNLLTHLEEHLGRMRDARAWPSIPFRIGRFVGQPVRGASSFVTIGLGKKQLHRGGRHVRQELLLAARGRWSVDEISVLLAAVAKDVWDEATAIEVGQVFGPAGPIVGTSQLEGFCAVSPLSFEKALSVCTYEETPIEILQLIPITAGEAELVASEGIAGFLECIRDHKPDLLDLDRPPMCDA